VMEKIGKLARARDVEPRWRLHNDVGLHKGRSVQLLNGQPLRQ
jgi:hypothetical protein